MRARYSTVHHARHLFCFCVFIVFLFTAHAQRIVTGKVTDVETGEPVPAASVYIAGSTVGTTTGNDGLYELKLPGQGSYELVVSHVAYEATSRQIVSNRAFIRWDIALKIHEMDDVIITHEKTCGIGDYNMFWNRLLGQLPSLLLSVTNQEDLYCYLNEKTMNLKLSCRVPLQIVESTPKSRQLKN